MGQIWSIIKTDAGASPRATCIAENRLGWGSSSPLGALQFAGITSVGSSKQMPQELRLNANLKIYGLNIMLLVNHSSRSRMRYMPVLTKWSCRTTNTILSRSIIYTRFQETKGVVKKRPPDILDIESAFIMLHYYVPNVHWRLPIPPLLHRKQANMHNTGSSGSRQSYL